MEARNLPNFGQHVLLQELTDTSSKWVDKSVNVAGRLDAHDVTSCQGTLVSPKSQASVLIDTTLVEPFNAKIGGMFQFIGEVKQCGGGDVRLGQQQQDLVMLQARVVRCCDSLDLRLYEQAVKVQRQYLDSRQKR